MRLAEAEQALEREALVLERVDQLVREGAAAAQLALEAGLRRVVS